MQLTNGTLDCVTLGGWINLSANIGVQSCSVISANFTYLVPHIFKVKGTLIKSVLRLLIILAFT